MKRAIEKAAEQVVRNIVYGDHVGDTILKATKYVAENVTVKATRKLYGGKIDRRYKRTEIMLTIGPPNYAERQFIKTLKKAGEPFPVKKVQLKMPK